MKATNANRKARPRIEWLDLFRGAAVLAMIETHVVNSFLLSELRSPSWFAWLNWFNGLIAPSFLFIAGYAQGMAWRSTPLTTPALGRKVRRLLGIAALGYALHFPFVDIGRHDWQAALRNGTVVDVLPCLAVTLLVVLALQELANRWMGQRSRVAGQWIMVCLGVGIVWLAPYSITWNIGPIPFAAYLNHHTGSLFPLFPWAAFVFFGVLAGMNSTFPTSSLLVAAGFAQLIAHLTQTASFDALGSEFFCDRLTWVLLLTALSRWVIRWWKLAVVLFVGRESLVIYAAHLIIIGRILHWWVDPCSYRWIGTSLFFVGILTLTFSVALVKAKWLNQPST